MKRTISLLVTLLLCLCSCSAGDKLGLMTVVIDPGHGGKDPGAVSKDSRTYEKTIVLDVSKRLARKIEAAYPDVNVVLTRDENFVSLADRATKANKSGADLFISIHVNSAKATAANGFSVHTMGQSSKKDTDLYEYNLNVCKRENSVILLEDDYSTKYEGFDPSDPESFIFMQLMQNAYLEQSLNFADIVHKKLAAKGPIHADRGISQDPFYVLWKTAMPSVLVELGFISNPDDLNVLRSAESRDRIADALFDAFKEYKSSYDSSLGKEDTGIVDKVKSKAMSIIKPENKDKNSAKETVKETVKTAVDTVAAVPSKDTVSSVKETAPVVQTAPETPVAQKPAPEPKDAPAKRAGEQYGVQIFATGRLIKAGDPAFKGLKPEVLTVGGINKYIVGVSGDVSKVKDMLPSVREKFPDAFIVKIVDGVSSIYRP